MKAETFPVFSQSEPNRDLPDAREVMTATFDLKDGDLSDFTPSATGGFLVHIDKRTPAQVFFDDPGADSLFDTT